MEGVGGGLAALAFWGFIAAVVLAGVWDNAKKRQVQHETLRRLIESGKSVDEDLMDKLLGGESRKTPHRDLRVAAIIVFSVAAGVAVLGLFFFMVDEAAAFTMLGAAGLLVCVGFGLRIASAYMARSDDAESTAGSADGGV